MSLSLNPPILWQVGTTGLTTILDYIIDGVKRRKFMTEVQRMQWSR